MRYTAFMGTRFAEHAISLSRAAGIAAMVLGGAACTSPDPPAPLTAELVGCGARFDDGRCALPAGGALRIFVPGANEPLSVTLDGGAISTEAERSPAGQLLRFTIERPGTLRVSRLPPAAPAEARFTLIDAEPPVVGDAATLERALASAPPLHQGPIASRLARLALRRGDVDAMTTRFVEAERAHRAAGRRSAILRDLEAQAFAALYLRPRYAEARRLIERHAALARDRRSRGLGRYNAGLLAWQTGDPAAAAEAFDAARRQLQPLGDVRETVVAAEMEAVVLRTLGRGRTALERLAALRDALPADAECDRARLNLNSGWLSTLERARGSSAPDPGPALRAAHAAFSTAPCEAEGPRRTAALNLALAAVNAGRAAEARRWLDTLPSGESGPLGRWRLDVEGRLALRAGALEAAEAHFARLEHLAAEVAPEAAWRAAVGRGEAALARGDIERALAAWRRAEASLDAESLRLPLDRDRARFLVDRARSVRLLVGQLTAQGRAAEALCAARLARGRALAGVALRDRITGLDPAARARWDDALTRWRNARAELEAAAAADWTLDDAALMQARATREAKARSVRHALGEALAVVERAGSRPSCDALRPPEADEVILAWFPAERAAAGSIQPGERSLVAFAATRGGARAVALPAGVDSPTALLAPFASELATHGRVRLIVGGGLERLDLHRSRWSSPSGRVTPIDRSHTVAWALDLPRRAARPGERAARALLVADPEQDLPAARDEAAAAADALRRGGWSVRALTGPAATGPAVREAIGGVTLLHYAGHGEARADDPFAARLPLADGGRLAIGDLLTVSSAPRWVVLTGCRTGFVDPQAAAGGLTLAHGFLLAGAEAVLATTEVVDDSLAGAVGSAVTARLAAPSPTDLPRAARDALGALGDRAGLEAFRVWVP